MNQSTVNQVCRRFGIATRYFRDFWEYVNTHNCPDALGEKIDNEPTYLKCWEVLIRQWYKSAKVVTV